MNDITRRHVLFGSTGLAGAARLPASLVCAAETVELTMASSHPTAIAWVGSLEELVVAEANKCLEAMGSGDRRISRRCALQV